MPSPDDIPRSAADRERVLGWLLVGLQFALIGLIVFGPLGARLPGADRVGVLAIIGVVLGVGLTLWGALALGSALTPHPSPRPGAPLVRSGPFAFVSHPIYLGLGLAGVAGAVVREGTIPLLLALALCVFLTLKARYEERLLRRAHPSGG